MRIFFQLLIYSFVIHGCSISKLSIDHEREYIYNPISGIYYSLTIEDDRFNFFWKNGLNYDRVEGLINQQNKKYFFKFNKDEIHFKNTTSLKLKKAYFKYNSIGSKIKLFNTPLAKQKIVLILKE